MAKKTGSSKHSNNNKTTTQIPRASSILSGCYGWRTVSSKQRTTYSTRSAKMCQPIHQKLLRQQKQTRQALWVKADMLPCQISARSNLMKIRSNTLIRVRTIQTLRMTTKLLTVRSILSSLVWWDNNPL